MWEENYDLIDLNVVYPKACCLSSELKRASGTGLSPSRVFARLVRHPVEKYYPRIPERPQIPHFHSTRRKTQEKSEVVLSFADVWTAATRYQIALLFLRYLQTPEGTNLSLQTPPQIYRGLSSSSSSSSFFQWVSITTSLSIPLSADRERKRHDMSVFFESHDQ